jgi:hypothetical protein
MHFYGEAMSDVTCTVESLTDQIGRLVAQRQQLRLERAATPALEENRRAIAKAQQLLSELLIQRHRPHAAA